MQTRRVAALALLAVYLQACTSWRAYQDPVPAAFAGEPPPEVRLTLRDGQRVELHGPVLRGDSLLGLELIGVPDREGPGRQRRVAVALDQVTKLETRQGNNAAVVLVMMPVVLGATYLVGSELLGNAMGD